MTVRIRLFSSLKEKAGTAEYILESEQPVSCEHAVSQLALRHFNLGELLEKCALAKNGNFVCGETLLYHGDELAILPPVSGG